VGSFQIRFGNGRRSQQELVHRRTFGDIPSTQSFLLLTELRILAGLRDPAWGLVMNGIVVFSEIY
jgi:hypothetical protein